MNSQSPRGIKRKMNTSPTIVSLDLEETSSDDESKQNDDTKQSKITFIVEENYEIQYPVQYVKTFKKVSEFFEIIDETYANESFVIDLTAYTNRLNFEPILQCLLNGTFIPLSKKYDYKSVDTVARYLTISNSIIKQIILDNERLFWQNLHTTDLEIRRKEKELRPLLNLKDTDIKNKDKEELRRLLNLKNTEIINVDEKFIASSIYEKYVTEENDNNTIIPRQYYNKWYIDSNYPVTDAIEPLNEYFNQVLGYYIAEYRLQPLFQKWKGKLIIAGGSVSDKKFGDIDLFLVTQNENEAKSIIEDVLNTLYNEGELRQTIIRTKYTITVIKDINIQIILRLYNSIAQILVNFDVDVICCAYDGFEFYCNERFLRAKINNEIIVDPECQSQTYGVRLKKYLHRFLINIAFIGYDKSRPHVDILSSYSRDDKRKGIAFTLAQFNSKITDDAELNDYESIKDYDTYYVLALAYIKAVDKLRSLDKIEEINELNDNIKSSDIFWWEPRLLGLEYDETTLMNLVVEHHPANDYDEKASLRSRWYDSEDILKKYSIVTKTLKQYDIKMPFKLYRDVEFLYGRESNNSLISKYLDWPVDFDIEFKIHHFSDLPFYEKSIDNWFLDLYVFD